MRGEEDTEEGMCLVTKSQASKREGVNKCETARRGLAILVWRTPSSKKAVDRDRLTYTPPARSRNCLLELRVQSGNETAASFTL